MEGIFTTYAAWWWLSAGLLLIGLEIFIPGTFLIWLGCAALIVALLTSTVPAMQDVTYQLAAFAVLGVVFAILGRQVYKKWLSQKQDTGLNRAAKRYVGQTVTLDTAIVNGEGRARVGDSTWIVQGPDLPEGSRVRVVGDQGTKLTVVAAE